MGRLRCRYLGSSGQFTRFMGLAQSPVVVPSQSGSVFRPFGSSGSMVTSNIRMLSIFIFFFCGFAFPLLF